MRAQTKTRLSHARLAAATLDYILVAGIILPLAFIVLPIARRIIQLVFELACVLISWPFM